MHHHTARTADHRRAFSTAEEGLRLFHTVLGAAPGAVACCVMPDHIHVLAPSDCRARLGVALGGYTRWRNKRRGLRGRLWVPVPPPTRVEGALKVRRNIRYIHLNPCRGGLVGDPLAWPLSTHIDALGLVQRPRVRRVRDAVTEHAYVSADPSVSVAGTELPTASLESPTAEAVLDAVSVVTRTPLVAMRTRGRPALAVRALRTLTDSPQKEIAHLLARDRKAVWRGDIGMNATLRLVERWAGDPRCTPLDDSALNGLIARSRYSRLPD